MAAAIPWIATAAATVLSAGAARAQGQAANTAAKFEVAQYEENAKAREIQGAREAEETRRQGAVLMSDARAAAASQGGGGVGESQFLTQIGRLGATVERNAISSIYQASVEAAGMRRRAAGAKYEGEAAKQAGNAKALVTAISGGADAYSLYKGM